jgi:hypothetical protein
MYESELQSELSEAIIDGEVDRLNLSITDNENCVVVRTSGYGETYYTADEARKLAKSIKCVSDQRWDGDNDDIVEYLRDLADVVVAEKVAEEVAEKWDGRELDRSL